MAKRNTKSKGTAPKSKAKRRSSLGGESVADGAGAGKPKLPIVTLSLPPPWKITTDTLIRAKLKKNGLVPVAFHLPQDPPPGTFPRGVKKTATGVQMRGMATDNQIIEVNAWAAQNVYNGAFFNGVTFMGYTYLSELAQRPEYRRFSEMISTEMTRKWIKLASKQTTKDTRKTGKTERIKQLEAELERLDVQGAFRKMAELDGFFGRAHLYIDTGDTEDRAELQKSIGNARDTATKMKFKGKTGFLRALKPIEPVWCYPSRYNANDPLKDDWYDPQTWFVQGKELHKTRLITFVGREVPDLLKPSYSFGGLSLSQMAKPYVDSWLRQKDAVGDLVVSFTQWILKTNLAELLSADGGAALFDRAALFSDMKNNQGLMLLNNDTEEFANVSTSLGSLDTLQAQAQEHMCSVVGIPVVKLLGIQPAGLNASSEGELTTWYEWIEAFQEKFFTKKLRTVLDWCMLNIWGEIDDDITFTYEPLKALSGKEKAELAKTRAEAGAVYITNGVIDPLEERERLAADPESGYSDIDVDDVPTVSEFDDDAALPPDLGSPIGQMGALERPEDSRRSGERDDTDDDSRRSSDPDDPGDRSQRDGRGDNDRDRNSRKREPREFEGGR